jgi:uncharacterized protein
LGNINSIVDLLEVLRSGIWEAKWDTLPRYCQACEVLDMCYGGCPKDRILRTPDGEAGLNYLCDNDSSRTNLSLQRYRL